MQILNAILRALQLALTAVVLGLSITLVRGQFTGSSPAVTNFAVACGVFGAIATLVGIVSLFVESLRGLVTAVVDGIATGFYFAGSIALAARLGVHSCTARPDGWNNSNNGQTPPNPYCAFNSVISGGAVSPNGDGFNFFESNDWFVSRCREAQALTAFMFFALAVYAAGAVFSLLSARRASRTSKV